MASGASDLTTAAKADLSYPVTPSQAKFLLNREMQQKRKNPGHMPSFLIGVCLFGPVEVDSIRAALNVVIQRRSALRVRFEAIPDLPAMERQQILDTFEATGVIDGPLYRQVLVESCNVSLRTCDFSPMENPEGKLAKASMAERVRPFDYTHPPLLRGLLAKLRPAHHVLVLAVDHIVSDAVSMRILREDFCDALLNAGCAADEDACVDTAFLDMALKMDRSTSPATIAALAYWRDQWSHFGSHRFAREDFPFEQPPPAPLSSFGAQRLDLGPATSSALIRFARDHKVTAHVLFLTALTVVLRHYTGRLMLPIWANFANRGTPGTERAVGWFATMHLIGLDVSASTSGRELLDQAKSAVANGIRHGSVPLQRLWDDLRWCPRFQDCQVFLEFWAKRRPTASRRSHADLTLRDLDLTDSAAPRLCPLGIHVEQDVNNEFSVCIRFAASLFPQPAMKELADYLLLVLRQLIAVPETAISALLPPRRG